MLSSPVLYIKKNTAILANIQYLSQILLTIFLYIEFSHSCDNDYIFKRQCIGRCNSTALFYIGNNNYIDCEINMAFMLFSNYSLINLGFSKESCTKYEYDLFTTRTYIVFFSHL